MNKKIIPGFEGYEACSDGYVISLPRVWLCSGDSVSFYRKYKGGILKPWIAMGYFQVGLRRDGKSFKKKVHRIMAEVFIPNPENKPFVNHKNGNKLDNRVENLEWATIEENCKHASEHGLSAKGDRNAQSSISNEDVVEIKLLFHNKTFKHMKDIARHLNISYAVVWNICTGKSWNHIQI